MPKSFINPSPELFVESHLKVAGIVPMSNGWWSHDLQVGFTTLSSSHFRICFLLELHGQDNVLFADCSSSDVSCAHEIVGKQKTEIIVEFITS